MVLVAYAGALSFESQVLVFAWLGLAVAWPYAERSAALLARLVGAGSQSEPRHIMLSQRQALLRAAKMYEAYAQAVNQGGSSGASASGSTDVPCLPTPWPGKSRSRVQPKVARRSRSTSSRRPCSAPKGPVAPRPVPKSMPGPVEAARAVATGREVRLRSPTRAPAGTGDNQRSGDAPPPQQHGGGNAGTVPEPASVRVPLTPSGSTGSSSTSASSASGSSSRSAVGRRRGGGRANSAPKANPVAAPGAHAHVAETVGTPAASAPGGGKKIPGAAITSCTRAIYGYVRFRG